MINTNKGNMKTIKYKDKKYKLPFEVGLPEDPTTEEVVRNRFGGESCTLPASPTVGDTVYVKAPSNCSTSNKITINRAGSQTIDGETAILLESPHAALTLIYAVSDVWVIV